MANVIIHPHAFVKQLRALQSGVYVCRAHRAPWDGMYHVFVVCIVHICCNWAEMMGNEAIITLAADICLGGGTGLSLSHVTA